jgi:hypothetical protein
MTPSLNFDELFALPYIAETIALVTEATSEETASDYMAAAQEKLLSTNEPHETCSCTGPLPHEYGDRLFSELWRLFACNEPDLFPALTSLSGQGRTASGAALAWTHLGGHAERVPPENPIIASAWNSLFMVLNSSAEEAWPSDAYAVNTWALDSSHVLNTYLTHHNWSAISFFYEPALRKDIVFRDDVGAMRLKRRWREEKRSLYTLYLHERIHRAMADVAMPDRHVYLSPLRAVVNEGITELLARSFMTSQELSDFSAFSKTLWDNPNGYNRQVAALLSLLPGFYLPELTPLWRFGCDNLSASSDRQVAQMLSHLASEEHSPSYWYRYFTSLETRLHLRFHDGEQMYLLGTWTHREDGPAVIRPSGANEYWREGVEVGISPGDLSIGDILSALSALKED